MSGKALRCVLSALLSACANSPPVRPGAELVRVMQAPSADYARVKELECRIDEAGQDAARNRARCIEQLRSTAWDVDADAIVIERETFGIGGCKPCVAMRAVAYKRQLPWEKEGGRKEARPQGPVYVNARLASGTCFAVGAKGLVLTAKHVIEDAKTICVSFGDGRHGVARPVRGLQDKDLELLQVSLDTPEYLGLGDASAVKLGDRVWTLGYPLVDILGLEPKFSSGTISALTGIRDAPEVFQISVPVQPGNSGGPLLNQNGLAIGIITSTVAALPFLRNTGTLPQGLNYAVKGDFAKPLLGSAAPAGPVASEAATIEKAKASVCLVEVAIGDGLLLAHADFGEGFEPRSMTQSAFDALRSQCDASNAEACLTVATTLAKECKSRGDMQCRQLRFAKTLLAHACAVGRPSACSTLAESK